MNVAKGIYIEKSGNRMERSYQKIQKVCLPWKISAAFQRWSNRNPEKEKKLNQIRPSFYRSIRRTKECFPKSPRKKTKVLDNLAKKFKLRIQFQKKGCRKVKILNEGREELLTEYLECPEMTYTTPGRKDIHLLGRSIVQSNTLKKNTFPRA